MRWANLNVAVVIVAVGCQRPVPESNSSPAAPEFVAPPFRVEGATGSPPVSKHDHITSILDDHGTGANPLSKAEVLFLLAAVIESEDVDQIVAVGERLLPAFEQILNDPSISDDTQRHVLGFLAGMNGDRSRFIDHALRRFSSNSGDLRRAAVGFVGATGSEREAAVVTAMLLDSDSTVRLAATKALAKIGGEREVVVFDLMLRNANRYEEDGKLILSRLDLEDFAKYRDELKARLKAEKDKPKAPPPEKK